MTTLRNPGERQGTIPVTAVHTVEEVNAMLTALRLTGVKLALAEMSAEPWFGCLPFLDKLWKLLKAETTRRENNGLRRRLKAAQLTSAAEPTVIRERREQYGLTGDALEYLMGGAWLSRGLTVIVVGPTGTGKTDFGSALCRGLMMAGHRAACFGFRTLMMELCALFNGSSADEYRRKLAWFCRADVLMIDDFCSGELRVGTDAVLCDLVDCCQTRRRGLIIVSQSPVGQWVRYLGQGPLAEACVDRLMNHATVIETRGASKRSHRPVNLTALAADDGASPGEKRDEN